MAPSKWLFDVGGGNAIESVFIPKTIAAPCACPVRLVAPCPAGSVRPGTKASVAISPWAKSCSAVVCRAFLRKHLGTNERVISNVVMMGMGSLCRTTTALIPALKVMLDDHGYDCRVGVSPCQPLVVPFMDRLGQDCPVALAVSLHAPNDALRDQLVPLNRKYPLAERCRRASDICKWPHATSSSFEYCMLAGVNDQPTHALELLDLVRSYGDSRVWCKFNLIPFNPFPASGLAQSPATAVAAFAKILSDGALTTIRKTRGDDIDAACGQWLAMFKTARAFRPVFRDNGRS